MEVSIILAKIIGVYLVVVSIAMFARTKHFIRMIDEMVKSRAVMGMTMFFTLILGIILVVMHNVWVMAWPVFITIIAWLTLSKSLFYMFFSEKFYSLAAKMNNRPVYLATGAIGFLIGLMLICKGFYS